MQLALALGRARLRASVPNLSGDLLRSAYGLPSLKSITRFDITEPARGAGLALSRASLPTAISGAGSRTPGTAPFGFGLVLGYGPAPW